VADLALAIAVKGDWDPAALRSALAAAGALDERFEIHLACDRVGPTKEALSGIAVHVRKDASLFQLWGIAAARSHAPHVAILHAHAPPAPGWGQAMLAHLGEADALCGPVEPRYPASDPRIIGYLVEYVQFHRPKAPDLDEVPGNNLILRRSMLGSPEALEREGFSKTPMLAAGALKPLWVDEALVQHDRPFALGAFCTRRFRHGRAYGALQLSTLPGAARAIAILKTPALPFVRTARILRHAGRLPAMRRAAFRHLLAILAAETFWSAGELVGALTGNPGPASGLD
jgi:hypothetical protein